MGEGTTSILLVDDHTMVGQVMVLALQGQGFGPVVAMDTGDLSADAVLACARALSPDIVLLDLHLGGAQSGLALVAPLRKLGARVLLFTASTDPVLLAAGLREGAEAVVDKAMSFAKVIGTLRDLAAGRELLAREEREALIEVLDQHVAEEQARLLPFRSLTDREGQVFRRLIDGVAPKQIARDVGISVSTVRGHIERILQKLDVSSQREALALARAAAWPGDQRPLEGSA